MIGKKGMSPLIATILLMAFAVALGAVIMNWSTNLPEGGPDCSEITLNVRQFCLADGMLKIEIRNTGEVSLEEVSLTVSDSGIDIPRVALKDSELQKGATLRTNIPFGFTQEATVGIIPSVDVAGEAEACVEPIQTFTTIPNC